MHNERFFIEIRLEFTSSYLKANASSSSAPVSSV